jgi:hypothetical protein
MIAKISTVLDTTIEPAWKAAKKSSTLIYVTRGLLTFSEGTFPDEWQEGEVVRTRLFFFGLLPAWSHHLHFVRIDNHKHVLYTNEGGGLLREWNHLIKIEPESEGRCRYTDEIEIRAGLLTPLVWLYAHLFYRYRQMRWKGLAVKLE